MKRFFCFILAVVMLAGLAACSDDPAESSAVSSETSEESSAPSYMPEPVINGAKLSEYTVVFINEIAFFIHTFVRL